MLLLRSLRRSLSSFLGTPEHFMKIKDTKGLTHITLIGHDGDPPTPYYSSNLSAPGMDAVMGAINTNQNIKDLFLRYDSHTSEHSIDSLCKGLVRNRSLENLAVGRVEFDEISLFQLFSMVRDNHGLKEFRLIGHYHGDNLSRKLVFSLADIVKENKTLQRINLDDMHIAPEHFPIILNPYENIKDRNLVDIQLHQNRPAPDHPKVNSTDIEERPGFEVKYRKRC